MNAHDSIYNFEYPTLQKTEAFQYYQIPKALFENKCFTNPQNCKFSRQAKLLYALLLNRVSWSRKNKLMDEHGHIYILFTNKQIREKLSCCDKKATALLRELESVGLIKRNKKTMKADKIYVLNFASPIKNNEGGCGFNYFTMRKQRKFKYYEMPTSFFKDKHFTNPKNFKFSADAKLLYSILLNNLSLSRNGEWTDKYGRVYINFENKKIQKILDCGDRKATSLLRELETIGLIIRDKKTTDSDKIYVMNFTSTSINSIKSKADKASNSIVENSAKIIGLDTPTKTDNGDKSHHKGICMKSSDIRLPNHQKYDYGIDNKSATGSSNIRSIKPNYIKPDSIYPNLSIKTVSESFPQQPKNKTYKQRIGKTEEKLKLQIEYDRLLKDLPDKQLIIDELVAIMVEMLLCNKDDYYIGKNAYKSSLVKNRVEGFTYGHIEYIITCLENNRSDYNIKAYLAKCIFNAPTTYSAFRATRDIFKPKQEYSKYPDASYDLKALEWDIIYNTPKL